MRQTPNRPDSIPATAVFDTDLGAWEFSIKNSRGERDGQCDFYRADGSLYLNTHFVGGVQVGPFSMFHPNGELECPHSDLNISEESGEYWHGQHVNTWHLLDRDGSSIRIVQCGSPFDANSIEASPAFAQLEDSADWGWSLTESLVQSSRVREALYLAARVAARNGERERLENFLARVTFSLRPERRAQRGELLMNNATATLEGAIEELVTGTEPASAYRVMASLLEGAPRIALDWVQASLLLEPERPLTYFTRALLRLELGDDIGAAEDAERCTVTSVEVAQFIRESLRIYFGEFTFWPNREHLEPPPEGAPDVQFEQPLEAVRLQVQIYATRLCCLRQAIQTHLGTRQPDWLPPDLTTILPNGPVELRRLKATLVDESELGNESAEVEIDESVDTARQGVTSLMTQARANWAALTWLCWAAGLDHFALPERIDPPAHFKSAVSQAVMRQFQVEDRLKTGGMLSLTQGLVSFDWEGFPVDSMNPRLLAVASAEYLEMRAMFLWLIWDKNVSPFQSDLRGD